MKIEKIDRNRYSVNTYIVYDEKTKDAVIIDPAVNFVLIEQFVKEHDLNPLAILLTHGHIDHIADTIVTKEKYSIPIYIHVRDNEMVMRSELNLSNHFGYPNLCFEADHLLRNGDIISFGALTFEVIHTPGHTEGGICLLIQNHMITGDTLFKGSMGRTDLYGGSEEHMKESLRKLMNYPGDIIVHPGHGGDSTISAEKQTNPFVRNLC